MEILLLEGRDSSYSRVKCDTLQKIYFFVEDGQCKVFNVKLENYYVKTENNRNFYIDNSNWNDILKSRAT